MCRGRKVRLSKDKVGREGGQRRLFRGSDGERRIGETIRGSDGERRIGETIRGSDGERRIGKIIR